MQSEVRELSEGCIPRALDGMEAHTLALVTQEERKGLASQAKRFHTSSTDQRTIPTFPLPEFAANAHGGTLLAFNPPCLIFERWCWKRRIIAVNGHKFSGDVWLPIRALQRQAPRALYGNHVPGVKLIPALVSACLSVYI